LRRKHSFQSILDQHDLSPMSRMRKALMETNNHNNNEKQKNISKSTTNNVKKRILKQSNTNSIITKKAKRIRRVHFSKDHNKTRICKKKKKLKKYIF